MEFLAGVLGLLCIGLVLTDAFVVIVLPRTVGWPFRISHLFYQSAWRLWVLPSRRWAPGAREIYFSVFGPLSLLVLLAIWALLLMGAFALLHWALGSALTVAEGTADFGALLYFSGTTFVTLGLGDVTTRTPVERFLTVAEAGLGLGFLAVIIGYLPALHQAFADRDVGVALSAVRAGTPPSSGVVLRRHYGPAAGAGLLAVLLEWQAWTARTRESHVSHALLAYYRSHHAPYSWVATLSTILDVSALLLVLVDGGPKTLAHDLFRLAHRTVLDQCRVMPVPLRPDWPERLPPEELARLRQVLAEAGVPLRPGTEADAQLAALRQLYEPPLQALAAYLCLALPTWLAPADAPIDPLDRIVSAVSREDWPASR